MNRRLSKIIEDVELENDKEFLEIQHRKKCSKTELHKLNSSTRVQKNAVRARYGVPEGNKGPKDQQYNHFTWLKPYPRNKEEQDLLAEELVRWVMKGYPKDIPDSLMPFAIQNGLNPHRLKIMATNNPYYRELYEFACSVISSRVYDEWRYQKICKDFARDFLYEHDPLFAARHKELQKLKNEDTNQRGNITVIMDKSPDCSQVPTRKLIEGEKRDE